MIDKLKLELYCAAYQPKCCFYGCSRTYWVTYGNLHPNATVHLKKVLLQSYPSQSPGALYYFRTTLEKKRSASLRFSFAQVCEPLRQLYENVLKDKFKNVLESFQGAISKTLSRHFEDWIMFHKNRNTLSNDWLIWIVLASTRGSYLQVLVPNSSLKETLSQEEVWSWTERVLVHAGYLASFFAETRCGCSFPRAENEVFGWSILNRFAFRTKILNKDNVFVSQTEQQNKIEANKIQEMWYERSRTHFPSKDVLCDKSYCCCIYKQLRTKRLLSQWPLSPIETKSFNHAPFSCWFSMAGARCFWFIAKGALRISRRISM